MRKLILLVFLFVSISMSAQFKFGAIGGVAIGSKDVVVPMDSFKTVFNVGPLIEYGGSGFSIRSGLVFQSDERLFIPLQGIIKSSRQGGFVGLGASFDMLNKADNKGMFDFILGNKFARNTDISICFSYPFKGTIHDALLSIRLTLFPLTTCKNACGF